MGYYRNIFVPKATYANTCINLVLGSISAKGWTKLDIGKGYSLDHGLRVKTTQFRTFLRNTESGDISETILNGGEGWSREFFPRQRLPMITPGISLDYRIYINIGMGIFGSRFEVHLVGLYRTGIDCRLTF